MMLLPKTEDSLVRALSNELLHESHGLDFKKQINQGKGANRDLAKDLAAFAVDGGALYIGINEGRDGAPHELAPQSLQGLRERIDQIARTGPDPAVAVVIHEIPTAADPSIGYLLVEVPPSADAPHMVDGRYMGRSDTTNYVLSDAEVVRLHANLARGADAFRALLDDEVSRDPTGPQHRHFAHLFVVAQPVKNDETLLVRSVEPTLRAWASAQIGRQRRPSARWSPDIGQEAVLTSNRSMGVALHSSEIGPDRTITATDGRQFTESYLLDLEIREDGGLRLFCSRASDQRNGSRLLMLPIVVGLTRRTLEFASRVAEASNYQGSWDVGLRISNLHGAVSHEVGFNFQATARPFSEDTYGSQGRFTQQEVEDQITVADRLLGRLLRAHGTDLDSVLDE